MKKLLLAAIALASLGGCDPYLYQQSLAPPGRSARLDEVTGFWGTLKHYRLEVSKGVALALTCAEGRPCEKMRVVSDNPAIAEVRLASLAQLQSVGYGPHANQQQPAAAFVVVGKSPGTTRLHISAKEGSRDVVVTVVAPPAPAVPMVAASPGVAWARSGPEGDAKSIE